MKVNTHIKSFLLCLGIIASLHAMGQDNDQMPSTNTTTHTNSDTYYKYSLQGGVEVPYPMGDNAFFKSLVGIYMFHVAQQFSINKHLYGGVEFQDAEFSISINPVNYTITPNMFTYLGGLDFGYHTTMAKDFMTSITLFAGEAVINYTSAPIHIKASEPTFETISLMEGYTVDEDLRIGFEVTFTSINYTFDPYAIGINNAGISFEPSDIKSPMTYFSWGLGIYWGFGKGK
jgi:hypothetical protein